MLSFKRFLYIIVLVAILAGISTIYSINEGRLTGISIQSSVAPEREFLEDLEEAQPEGGQGLKVWLLGDAGDERYGTLYGNVRQLFADLHITAVEETWLDPGRAAEADLVIFCHATLSRYADAKELESFIAGGGRVILAAGLAEGEEDAALWQAFGIENKFAGGNFRNLAFEQENPLLPLQPEEAVYGGDSDSAGIEVREGASVYIRDKETGVPVLYTYGYQDGGVCLVNGSFLADLRNMGLLTGAMGALLPDFVYPVLGVKAVFLDNFPMITSADDALCMQLYGYSTLSFVRDVIWPGFQGISLRTGTSYTSSALAASSEERFPDIRDELFTIIGKSALRFGGELVYAASCPENGTIFFNRNFMDRFSAIFKNYTIQGLALENDRFSPELLRMPGADIRFVRGRLDSQETRLSWKEGLTVFPAATVGNTMDDGNLFSLCSVLGAYGMVSHVFDINALFAGDDNEAAWDSGKKQIGIFEGEILSRVPWLESRTLSQTEGDVRSYQSLSYSWRRTGNRLELDCGGAAKGQAFFYHTDSSVVSAEGLTYQEVGDGYYLLRVQENYGSLELEGE